MKHPSRAAWTGAIMACGVCAHAASPAVSGAMMAVPRDGLCVTEGSVGDAHSGMSSVNQPKMRAYLNRASSDAASLEFTYLGPTALQSKLASGAAREQLGLKLRAQDACNLVYVMWRLRPDPQLVVSVKRNPGLRSSAECGNRGYRNVKPQATAPLAPVLPGSVHELGASLRGTDLEVRADGRTVWSGNLGDDARVLQGPVGIRTDNAHLEFQLRVAEAASSADSSAPSACRSGPQEAE
jgi:hypothetical protein